MEDIIHENKKIIIKIENFLSLEMKQHLNKWWLVSDSGIEGCPKTTLMNWESVHPSSLVKPKLEDTKVIFELPP